MRVIVCIDDCGGMLFNHRRQSRDRVLLQDVWQTAGGGRLLIHSFSAKMFAGTPAVVDESFLATAGEADTCFVENCHLAPYLDRVSELILYCWNEAYPYDFTLDVDPTRAGFRLAETVDFAGYSHKTITKERYVR